MQVPQDGSCVLSCSWLICIDAAPSSFWMDGLQHSSRRMALILEMGWFKSLGERVRARDFERQVTKLQFQVSILNRFTQLGTPETVRVA